MGCFVRSIDISRKIIDIGSDTWYPAYYGKYEWYCYSVLLGKQISLQHQKQFNAKLVKARERLKLNISSIYEDEMFDCLEN